MAAVWAARQTALDRLVAIKLFRLGAVSDAEWVARFKQEARTAAHLVHPGIVQVYDAGEADDILYYVMELVEGCSVAELIEIKGRLLERHALAVAFGVAEALRFAWQKAGIIHCDIKPANILIDREGVVRVTDLGLARTAASRPLADEKEITGTPNYVSPEQAQGETKLDFRTDVYSLGATLYHMATGVLPFGEFGPLEVLRCQLEGYLTDPVELNPELSPATAWLIEKMMTRDRSARYQSWDAVVEDIEWVRERGLLRSALPPAGTSTVLRSPNRKPPRPRKPATASRLKPAGGSDTPRGEKRSVVLPRDLKERAGLKERAMALQATYPFIRLLAVMAVTITLYGWLYYLVSSPVHREMQAAPRRDLPRGASTVQKVRWEEKPVERLPQPEARSVAEAPVPVRPAPAPQKREKIAWRNSSFLQGARAFNHAYAEFRKYTATRGNARQLQQIEEEVRQAIRSFESCREAAPAEVDINELIDRSYHLLADIRQAMRGAPLSGETAPVPEASGSRPPPALRLALQVGWDRVVPARNRILDDLYELLFEHGSPSPNLDAPRAVVLFDEITYLMPARDALIILGSRSRRKKPVRSPAFPPNSFYYYEVQGDFGEGFSTLLLVADVNDQVAAIQLADNSTREELWLNPALFSDEWRTYDFVRGRQRATPRWKIAHEVAERGMVVCIRTELADRNPEGYFQLGSSRARLSLYLPRSLVNVLLYYVQRQRNLIPAPGGGKAGLHLGRRRTQPLHPGPGCLDKVIEGLLQLGHETGIRQEIQLRGQCNQKGQKSPAERPYFRPDRYVIEQIRRYRQAGNPLQHAVVEG